MPRSQPFPVTPPEPIAIFDWMIFGSRARRVLVGPHEGLDPPLRGLVEVVPQVRDRQRDAAVQHQHEQQRRRPREGQQQREQPAERSR